MKFRISFVSFDFQSKIDASTCLIFILCRFIALSLFCFETKENIVSYKLSAEFFFNSQKAIQRVSRILHFHKVFRFYKTNTFLFNALTKIKRTTRILRNVKIKAHREKSPACVAVKSKASTNSLPVRLLHDRKDSQQLIVSPLFNDRRVIFFCNFLFTYVRKYNKPIH